MKSNFNKQLKQIIFIFSVLFILAGCSGPDKELVYTPDTLPEKHHSFSVAKDIVWAKVKKQPLEMDIYVPDTEGTNHPVLVVYHGGGWLINDKSIMDDFCVYIASHSDFIVCNVDYRLLTDCDNTTTMNEIIEDAMGALIWIKENISHWKGDPERIAITGDSSGGHLASMILLCGQNLSATGFPTKTFQEKSFSENPFGFKPSYLPKDCSVEDCIEKDLLSVRAAVISYGAFDIKALAKNGLEGPYNIFWDLADTDPRSIFREGISVKSNPEFYEAVSPIYRIPQKSQIALPPQLLLVGSKDKTTPPKSVRKYLKKLDNAGQDVSYWEHKNRPHAFLDSGSNPYLKINFEEDGVPAAKVIISFLNGVI